MAIKEVALFGEGEYLYALEDGWEQLPDGWSHNDVASVAVDSSDRVYLFHRGKHPVMIYQPDGTFVGAWGDGMFVEPHGIAIGPDGSVYCVDKGGHAVFKCTPDGQPVLTIGNPGRPSDTGFVDDYRSVTHAGAPFNFPTNAAFGPNGEIYVADGYGNSCVHTFSPDGELMGSWGTPGKGPGELSIPHAIAVDPSGNVFVADRENDRIEVFDPEGRLLDIWDENLSRPDDLAITPQGEVIVVELGLYVGRWPFSPPDTPDGPASRLSIFDLSGRLLARWGTRDSCSPGNFYAPHGVAVDSEGAIYVSEVIWSGGGKDGDVPADCHTVQKFVRQPARE